MRLEVDADATTGIPEMFCWTKYGTEAGEEVAGILSRKEAERQGNDGVFLWGIGNAVGPSIEFLLEHTARPQVVFTPMLSRAAARDVSPESVAIWHGGDGLDGNRYEVPAHSIVTSRATSARRAHYALVCKRGDSLVDVPASGATFAAKHVQNLRSGAQVGASQVTSVVRRIACGFGLLPSSYRVSFTADLVAPYLVRLTEYTLQDPAGTVARRTPVSQRNQWTSREMSLFA